MLTNSPVNLEIMSVFLHNGQLGVSDFLKHNSLAHN